jgi:flagellar basal-body rod modification protein FlgD
MAPVNSATSPTPPLGAAQPTPAGAIPANPKGQLGKDQFLQLMVAQMRNQDPLSPMDGQQMAAQMAQFSTVEQLITLNDTMAAQASGQSALLESLGGSLTLGAIGKTVEVDASQAVDENGDPAPANTVLRGKVDGVRFTPEGPMLTMGEYEFPFGAILSMK